MTEIVNGEDQRKRRGASADQVLEIHACRLRADHSENQPEIENESLP
jgi:hypothetical protein